MSDYQTGKEIFIHDPYNRHRRAKDEEVRRVLEAYGGVSRLPTEVYIPSLSEARAILGSESVRGPEEIRKMETVIKEKTQGKVEVSFDLTGIPPLPYTKADYEVARSLSARLILRRKNMTVNLDPSLTPQLKYLTSGSLQPINYLALRSLFLPFPEEDKVIYNGNTWPEEIDQATSKPKHPFALDDTEMQYQWALVIPAILDGSLGISWNDQQPLLDELKNQLTQQGATQTEVRRKSAVETEWDTLFEYCLTGERTNNIYDWGRSGSAGGRRVSAGWGGDGFRVGDWPPDGAGDDIGVVPQW